MSKANRSRRRKLADCNKYEGRKKHSRDDEDFPDTRIEGNGRRGSTEYVERRYK